MSMKKMRIFSTVDDVYAALEEGVLINDKFTFNHPTKTGGKSIQMSLGRIWWNLLLPSNFELVDSPVKQVDISRAIKKIIDENPPDVASDFLGNINKETFRMSTCIPSTFDIESVILSDSVKRQKKELKKDNIQDPIEFSKRTKTIANEIMSDMDTKDQRLNNINTSNAKAIPWEQLMVAFGPVSDIENQILGPIQDSINDGISPKDFYIAAAESRKGFYYKAAISSKPGYLARRIVMANAHITLDDTIKDCGSKKTFDILVDKNLANVLQRRYIVVNGKTVPIGDPNKLIGKVIKLRSPLYCKSRNGICPKCYGDSWLALNNRNIGMKRI